MKIAKFFLVMLVVVTALCVKVSAQEQRPYLGNARVAIGFDGPLAAVAESLIAQRGGLGPDDVIEGPCPTDQPALCLRVEVGQPVMIGGSNSTGIWGRSASLYSGGASSGVRYPVSVVMTLNGRFIGQATALATVTNRQAYGSVIARGVWSSGTSYSGTDPNAAIGNAASQCLVRMFGKPGFVGKMVTSVTWSPFANKLIAEAFSQQQ